LRSLPEDKVDRDDAERLVGARRADPVDDVEERRLDDVADHHLADELRRHLRNLRHVDLDALRRRRLRLRPPVVQAVRARERLGEHEHRVPELEAADDVVPHAELAHPEHLDAELRIKLLLAPRREGLPDPAEHRLVARRAVGLLEDALEELLQIQHGA